MVTTLGVVDVLPAILEAESSRLAGIARRRFAGKTLLEWVVRRASEADHVDQIAVAAGGDALSLSLARLAPGDAQVVISDASDALGRLADVVRQIRCSGVVLLSVSEPFVDPILIDRLITATATDDECDYASFCFSDGRPATESPIGVFAQWCRSDAILEADRLARSHADRREPARFIYSHPEIFATKLIPAPSRLDRSDLRLGIHDEEDWENVQTILDALGPESLDWQYITTLLDRHPVMCERMAQQNRAHAAMIA